MTSTKLPPDSVLATEVGGKDIDPELEAKLKRSKDEAQKTQISSSYYFKA